MTTEEIITTLKTALAEVEWEYPMEYAVAIDEAIKALISTTQMSGTCQSHIRRAKTMMEWKPVSTPPAEKEIVLVTCEYLKIPIMAMYKDGRYLFTESQTPLPLTAVAWTPMPEVYHFNEDYVEAKE